MSFGKNRTIALTSHDYAEFGTFTFYSSVAYNSLVCAFLHVYDFPCL